MELRTNLITGSFVSAAFFVSLVYLRSAVADIFFNILSFSVEFALKGGPEL